MRGLLRAVDDRRVGRIGLIAVVLGLFMVGRCSTMSVSATVGSLPIVGPIVVPTAASAPSVARTAAAPAPLPDVDLATWFAAEATDPADATVWKGIDDVLATTLTRDGWAAFCKKASDAAGGDRAANAQLGALACSKDPTVTALQRFAVHLLQLRAAVALYVKGVPGFALPSIQARQGIVRLDCAVDIVPRQGPASAFGGACAKALETAYLTSDVTATLTAVDEAYKAAAAEIARMAPTVDAEPGWFTAAATPTPTK